MGQLAYTYKEGKVIPFDKCPMCEGEVVAKQTEKLLRGGVNLAVVTVPAEICLRCGEHLYSPDTIHLFEQIRQKLSNQDVGEFEPLGRSFRVPG